MLLSSVQFSCSVMSDFLRPHELQHARLPCPSLSPRVCSNSCPLSQGCYPTISSSATPSSSCPQSFPTSDSSNESALRIRWPKYWSFSFSNSPSNEYSGLIFFRMDWMISLLSKGLSRVFSNTTVQKHQFLWCSAFFMVSHPCMTTRKTVALAIRTFVSKVSAF